MLLFGTVVQWSRDILRGHQLTNQNFVATTLDPRYQARNIIPNEESKYLDLKEQGPRVLLGIPKCPVFSNQF